MRLLVANLLGSFGGYPSIFPSKPNLKTKKIPYVESWAVRPTMRVVEFLMVHKAALNVEDLVQ